jgi:hypothetical protein
MKKVVQITTCLLAAITMATINANAQNSTSNNVSIGTDAPAFGAKIKANFPGATGGWARGFSLSNQSGAIDFIEFGAYGSMTNGVSTFSNGYIGTDYADANRHLTFLPNHDTKVHGTLTVNGNLIIPTAATNYVQIGTSTAPYRPGYRLFVDQGILTEKVKVAVAGTAQWSDYVFATDYKLMPLAEVEKFIRTNNHLPNVPSAAEMVKEGNDLGKTDAKLLEKIEELTLYMIEMKKEIENLKKENNNLKK